MPTLIARGATTLSLPDSGSLVWADEHEWTGIAQTTARVFGGGLVVQQSALTAGRPLTLEGGLAWARISRANLLALVALLDVAGAADYTVTLADGRRYTCTGRRDQGPPVTATRLPTVRAGSATSGPAVETDSTLYSLDAVRLLILATLTPVSPP